MANVILIGMPGCGKSTVGVLLAKLLGMAFMDTDVVLQSRECQKLQSMIDAIGIKAFLEKEEEAILDIDCNRTVIATGGSVVYGKDGMKHLHKNGIIVYIRLPFSEIERRLSNLATRGVALKENQTLYDLYQERIPLYESEADIVFDATGLEIEQTVSEIARRVDALNGARHGC